MSETYPMQFEPTYEDTVQCRFFSKFILESDPFLWEQLCSNINTSIAKLSEGYIWHRDEFKVYNPILENSHSDTPTHLVSTTNFGENIEDEWFIVHIVFELTKIYEELIVQIKDNDGEFLLIEAAECLPSWIKPDTTDNRVFIYKNHLHIIPPNLISIESQVNVKNAMKFIMKPDIQTQASKEIEKAIVTRIGNYPEKMLENFHIAIVKLPLHIAGLINLEPTLIAPIVNAYCNHDAIDAKFCKTLKLENCVTVQIKFTKFLYAMLIHSKQIYNNKNAVIEKDKAKSLGFKLTCGFHMIMKSSTNMYESKQFYQFLNSLKRNGYFKNNLEGSKDYQELLNKAKHFFDTVECPVNLSVVNKIQNIMNTKEYEQKIETMRNVIADDLCEDNEDWLSLHPEQLNDLLNTRFGKKLFLKNEDKTTPYNLTSALSNFIKKTSDFEGIETHNDIDNSQENIQFDADEFSKCVERFLDILTCKDNDSNSDTDLCDDEEDISLSNDDTYINDDEELDKELKLKLIYDPNENSENNKSLSFNIIQSMKEEQASTGPSSNLLRAMGLNKTQFLDSDDDEE